MEYFSCRKIEDFHMNFLGRVDEGVKLFLCCENKRTIPYIKCTDSIDNFWIDSISKREKIHNYGIGLEKHIDNIECASCHMWKKENWTYKEQSNYVNISVYPAPCQCGCIYCTVPKNQKMDTEEVRIGYEKLFEILTISKKGR